VRTESRRTVVTPARRDRGLVEGIDLGARSRAERDVQWWCLGFASGNPEIRLGGNPEAHRALGREILRQLHDDLIAERRECLEIEGLAAGEVADVETGMVEHVRVRPADAA
jgi:hypothetical protein